MLKIIQDYIPIGRKNRPGKWNPCEYITIHNTGNFGTGTGAKSHSNYIKSDAAAKAPVSWHYTVDDREIFQHLPDNETAYHAGDGHGPGNTRSIGIEICTNCDGDLLKATDNAAELTAALCVARFIPIENVVQHNHWSGKNCPQMLRAGKPYSYEVFLGKVKALIDAEKTPDTVKFDLFDRFVEIPGKLVDGVNYVSARALLEAMGCTVEWSGDTKTIFVRMLPSTIKVDIFGSATEIPGRLINGTNYVALRALIETMGLEVSWVPETHTVKIR